MKNKIIMTALAMALVASGCEEKFLDIKPLSNPTDVTFFSDENQLQLAINAIHGNLWSSSVEGMPLNFYVENTLTDNGVFRITDERYGIRALSNSAHDASSGFDGIYFDNYRAIGRCNNMLQNMERASDKVSEEKMNDFRAQALTLRAYFYHELIQYFGAVPFLDFLPTSTTGGFIERTSRNEVIDILLADLKEAAGLIDGSITGAQDRVTLAVVHGLSARIALLGERFEIAADAADASIEAAKVQGLSLHSSYGDLFTMDGENSSEIMLRVPFNEEWGRSHSLPQKMGYRFGSLFSQALPTQNLIDAYPTANGLPIDQDPSYDPTAPWENRDPRLKATIVLPGDMWGGYIYESHRDSLQTFQLVEGKLVRVLNEDCRSAQWPAGITGYLWKKYVDEENMQNNISLAYNDIILMRLGEIYLIKAEAEIEANRNLEEAAEALNTLRQRAWGDGGYPPVVVSSQEQMRKTLRMERRVELANEGFRYYDIIRWKIAEKARQEPLIGRILDIANASESSIPHIDKDGVVTYQDRSVYDDLRSLRVNGELIPNGYDARLFGNWQNMVERDFTAPRDYLLPIPQAEIELYQANGFALDQNDGY
ncbi:RagB/SusD family nutrient uptake outer membrane protein [Echinicola sediminis]